MIRHVDLVSERAVLGGAMLDRDIAQEVCSLLRAEHYYRDAHALVHEAVASQLALGRPVDHIGVRSALEGAGRLERAGGDEGLFALTDTIPSLANVSAHAKRVRELAALRSAVEAAKRLLAEAEQGVEDVADFLGRAEGAVGRAIEGHALAAEPVRLDQAMGEVIADLTERAQSGRSFGHRTGLVALDRQLGGMVPGELIVLGGRPGQGKTSLALELAIGVERSSQLPVFFQSIEMPRAQLAQRILSAQASVPLKAMREMQLQRGHMTDLLATAERMRSARVWLDDSPRVTVSDYARQLRRIQRQHGLAMGVIDYLQLMRAVEKHASREQAVSEISRSLKALAKELHVPILALASLNRGPENARTADSRPKMAHLRESGSIESDADTVMLLYREEEYVTVDPGAVMRGEAKDNRGIAEVIIDKNRNGATGTVQLSWNEEYTRFANLEEWRGGMS